MRIVQIIDSLESGGAERMAVNYANALSKKISFSGLVATRKQGLLLDQINKEVSYLFLNKTRKVDFPAVFRLRKYIKENSIDVIHAHSSSFFIAVLVKFTFPKIKIIWHDHYGISQDLDARKSLGLKFGSLFFSGVISVNIALKRWAETYLWCPNIIYLSNFIEEKASFSDKILLKGTEGKRIICVANLRAQKNHELLISAALLIKEKFQDWSFHLFGQDFHDSYSEKLNNKVNTLKLRETVFFYGAVNNVASALEQCNIAVLSSFSEGLPLAVLEYGLYKLPVVATNVGDISKIITSEKEGLLVESNDLSQFAQSIQKLIENENYRIEMGLELNKVIRLNFSEESIIQDYVLWLNSLTIFVA
ncbi:glycosyltransferase [Flavobacterium pectinovorum]|jgi:glycosyltransferase involved in cell wall biosynthesis|uniref:Glycosyltransferase n=1 Tax=Flavobacterium pectinovorum TaxID=29533 RepID=A0A502ERL5_9FLAO|nr:glycosyltransferase [Flavobacterium pectinovorum]TPG40137.1 glycosyltransferase [Flavobacterium pectinovorum]